MQLSWMKKRLSWGVSDSDFYFNTAVTDALQIVLCSAYSYLVSTMLLLAGLVATVAISVSEYSSESF
jgi:hypothetical protein